MIPVRLFEESLKSERLERRLNLGGISPTRKFVVRSIALKLEQLVIASGILSCNWLMLRSRTWSFCRWSRGGNWPEKPFLDRFRVLRNVKFPMEGLIWPPKFRPESSRATTRPGCVGLHFTPGHMQWLELEFQELNHPERSELISCLKACSQSTSVLLSGSIAQLIFIAPKESSNSVENISMVGFPGRLGRVEAIVACKIYDM